MADVFLAERLGDDGFRTRVALKRLHRGLAMDSYFIRQLVREARLLGQLEHNNIVKVFDLRRIGDEYYVVMEFVDGIDLAAVIKVHRTRKTRIPRPFFFHVALSLTEALAYAHNAVDPSGNPTPLIHRDIKPSNVMLSRRGIVKLTDFGIAHVGDGSVTGGLVQGTANYMSPEQAFGEERLTGASDVYSLGSVFYEMLTGRPLIDGDNYLKAIHQVRERRVSVEELAQLGVEPGLRVVIAKMLSSDAASRYSEMDNVRNDLQFVADRLKVDLSWHRIRAYVGRLMGILGRAPGRVTLSNVGLTALPNEGAARQLGPTPAPPEPVAPPPPPPPPPTSQPLGAVGPATPPTPVPQQRLERSGPVTQAVRKDLLDSYIAIAALESTGEVQQLPTATAQGLVALPPKEAPAPRPQRPGSRDPLDAATLAAPPPPMSSQFISGTPVGGTPVPNPAALAADAPTPPPARPQAASHASIARPAPASDWDDIDRTRVYAGPTPAQSGVYGTGEMRAVTGGDEDRTRPLPGGPMPQIAGVSAPPQSRPSGPAPAVPHSAARTSAPRTDLDDPTRFYAGPPPPTQTANALEAVPEPTMGPEAAAVARASGSWQAPPAAPRKPKRRPKRARKRPTKRRKTKGRGGKRRTTPKRRRKGVPPNVIGALIIVIVLLLAILALLLVKKYGPSAALFGNSTTQVASIQGLAGSEYVRSDTLPRGHAAPSDEVL
ncbi:MAG: protein kinase [Deltaproteobacteria bacterium]|nr:protein kinase [Deltaproteobacteria bacterium]